ncbi:MAG: ABC transporter ATP-binding protein [Acidobacteria bacterium]|nr:MAG: ABC transporter ATP-binding protein [Acidobacteriota bacterium]
MARSIVDVEDLAVAFPGPDGGARLVVDGVSLAVAEGEAMGLVGESGCGKTLTALAAVRLLPHAARVLRGSVRLEGEDVLTASEARMCALRGGVVGFVFQEPSQALNPVRSVGSQVTEAAKLHLGVRGADAAALAGRLLAEVGLDEPERVAHAYPHQLSGGERQRVLLAAALAAGPRALIADEPTSALDTVSQQRLVELIRRLRESRGLTLLFVSHDLALVGRVAERITVLYAGETVETGDRDALFGDPRHPYTQALLQARLGGSDASGDFATVPGGVPRAGEWGQGCRFAPRCPHAWRRCTGARPALTPAGDGRTVRCFLASDEEERRG